MDLFPGYMTIFFFSFYSLPLEDRRWNAQITEQRDRLEAGATDEQVGREAVRSQ